jgi:DUF1680 family protein
VNLFIPSELRWTERGLKLRLETQYPADPKIRVTVSCDKPAEAAFHLRYPTWAPAGLVVTVNGRAVSNHAAPGAYVVVKRTWKDGDVVQWTVPLALRTEPLPDDRRQVAVLYGPLLLAGKLAPLTTERQLLRDAPSSPDQDPDVPEVAVGERPVDQWVKPTGSPLQFHIEAPGLPQDLVLEPFYQMIHDRYAVYWRLTDPPQARP